jgi:hypothetical protein
MGEAGVVLQDVANAVGTVFNEILIPVFAAVLDGIKSLVNWIVTHWPEIKAVIGPVVDVMVKKLKEVRDMIIGAFDQAKTIGVKIGEIKTVVETKWQEIQTFVNGLPAAFVTAGTNIVQGLINGVVAKLKEFGTLWKNLSSDPIKTIENIFNMHSPSRVMYDAGANIVQGLINGIDDYADAAVRAMERTARDVQLAGATMYQTPASLGSVAAGDDAFDRGGRLGGALVPAMAAAGAGMAGSLPQSFNATMTINVLMDGGVLASTVVSIVQGMLQQERERYGK